MRNIVSRHRQGGTVFVTSVLPLHKSIMPKCMKFKTQRGAQVVEFALVLPLLLLVMLLIIDFGFLVYNKAIITNASREAARSGTVLTAIPWSDDSVRAVACRYAKNLLISPTVETRIPKVCLGTAYPFIVDVTRLNSITPPLFNTPVTVDITYYYRGFLTPASSWLLNVPVWKINATSTMNHE